MFEPRIVAISASESFEIDGLSDDGTNADAVVDLPVEGALDIGYGFSAGHVQGKHSEHSRAYVVPFDTLILFPEEGAALAFQGGEFKASKLDGVLVPGGATIRCRLPERFLFVTRQSGAKYRSNLPTPVHLAAKSPLDIAAQTRAASAFLGPMPSQKRSAAINVSQMSAIGMWGSSPYARVASPHPRYEFMFLQDGGYRATFNAKSYRFRTGDLFFVEKGANAAFVTDEPVRKIYWSLEQQE